MLGELVDVIDREGVFALVWNGDLYIKHVRHERDCLALVNENKLYGVQYVRPEADTIHITERITRLY